MFRTHGLLFFFFVASLSIVHKRFSDSSISSSHRSVFLKHATILVDNELSLNAKSGKIKSFKIQSTGTRTNVRLPSLSLFAYSKNEELRQWLVHLKNPVTEETKKTINEFIAPYKLGEYIPFNSYLLTCPSSLAHSLLSQPSVLMVFEFHSTFKLHSDLIDFSTKQHLFHIDSNIPTNNLTLGYSQPLKRGQNILRVRLSLESLPIDPHPSLPILSDKNSLALYFTNSWTQHYQHLLNQEVQDLELYKQINITIHGDRVASVRYPFQWTTPFDPIGSERRMNTLLGWLSQHPLVHWIEPHRPAKILNKFARYVIQSDVPEEMDIWTHGVHGEGQIIVVGDTGVDYDHCLFHDPQCEVPFNRVNHSHRKIVTYVTIPDETTHQYGPPGDNEGHGTHTAASICGDALSEDPNAQSYMSQYNGMAPKAKLAVYDYQDAGSPDIYLPVSIYDEFFLPAYRDPVKGRITSNSWGDEQGQYDVYAEDTDRFAWEHPEFVIVFAAGNYGDSGFHSVASPGIAKNCISVGSSLNAPDSFGAIGRAAGIEVTSPQEFEGVYSTAPANFGPPFDTMPVTSGQKVVFANPSNACSPLVNAQATIGHIVLVERGDCIFTHKAAIVGAAGASLMIVINNEDGPAVEMDSNLTNEVITVPSIMVSQHEGNVLFRSGRLDEIRIRCPVNYVSPDQSEARLSEFSSRGPTWDGRLKPDVCAPGDWIQSARSDHDLHSFQCPTNGLGITKMQGTSMAAPIAAGAVALVRNYFEGGFFKELGPFVPSSALVKAMMANSGKELAGEVTADIKHGAAKIAVSPIPSFFQGFGRIKLDDVLFFNDTEPVSDFSLFVKDSHSISAQQIQSYCFASSGNAHQSFRPLKVTLAWIDYPALPSTSLMLANNLDLAVFDLKNGNAYLGNQGGDYPMFLWDELNNMEQVIVRSPGTSTFLVQVLGTHIPQPKADTGGQPYSLVVTGPPQFQQVPIENCRALIPNDLDTALCPKDCSGHGACKEGRCICDANWAGAACTIPMTPLVLAQPKTSSINKAEWQYFAFELHPGYINLKFHITTSGGDPDFYVTRPHTSDSTSDGYPTLINWDYRNVDCDVCNGKTTHDIQIPDQELKAGVYVFGAYGYCCDSSTFTVTVTATISAALRVSLLFKMGKEAINQHSVFNGQFADEMSKALKVGPERIRVYSLLDSQPSSNSTTLLTFDMLPPNPSKLSEEVSVLDLWDRLVTGLKLSNRTSAVRQLSDPPTNGNDSTASNLWDQELLRHIDVTSPVTFEYVRVHYCEGEWREDCGDKFAFLKQYWPLFIIILLGISLVVYLLYRRRKQRILAATFKDGTKASNKFKFVNIEDLDVAAIEQAVEDEELELSTQRRDSDDDGDGDEKKRKPRRKEVRPKELASPAISAPQTPARPDIEVSIAPVPGANDQTPPKTSFSRHSDLNIVRLPEPSSVDSSLSFTPVHHPIHHEESHTPEIQSPSHLALDSSNTDFSRLRGRTEEELIPPEQNTPLISR